jgi:hypothetical protein
MNNQEKDVKEKNIEFLMNLLPNTPKEKIEEILANLKQLRELNEREFYEIVVDKEGKWEKLIIKNIEDLLIWYFMWPGYSKAGAHSTLSNLRRAWKCSDEEIFKRVVLEKMSELDITIAPLLEDPTLLRAFVVNEKNNSKGQ